MDDNELSTLILCKNVPFNNTYETTIDFPNATMQENFFKSYQLESAEIKTTYLRLNRRIQVDFLLDDLFGVNYCMVKNAGKWYYYFIVDKQYVNESNTSLALEMDVFQTYMFDYTLGESFILREHQDRFINQTTFKLNLEPENIEVGDSYKYIDKLTIKNHNVCDNLLFAYIWRDDAPPAETGYSKEADAANIKGIGTGLMCYCVPIMLTDEGDDFAIVDATDNTHYYDISTEDIPVAEANAISSLRYLNGLIDGEHIYNISLSAYAPAGVTVTKKPGTNHTYLINATLAGDSAIPLVIRHIPHGEHDFYDKYALLLKTTSTSANNADVYDSAGNLYDLRITAVDTTGISINNPKNIMYEPKVKIYPYRRYTMALGETSNILKPELFNTSRIIVNKSISMGGNTSIIPLDYAGYDNQVEGRLNSPYDFSMQLISDPYKNFMANNKNSFYTGTATSMISSGMHSIFNGIGSGLKTGSLAMGIASGVSGLIDTGFIAENAIAKLNDLRAAPDTIKRVGDDLATAFSYSKGCAYIVCEEILPQFKTKLFNYLYRYGYACNNFDVPDIQSRYWFNYIKTGEVTFSQNKVDSDYIDQLKTIYQRGTTIWHFRAGMNIASYKANNLLNYGKENVEMSLL